ncbi:ABC-type transport system substrate-binding protein [Streptomyces umbrinus]|uniref:ABC-type transport system substrate-binding protein n=1 Tax=Streptomyces umbrinus TaxID=67370 RepID=A0ABU0T728_9ACTN|nr:ABC-type transport system substrate-binding protein [Streptomyces umbrinus]
MRARSIRGMGTLATAAALATVASACSAPGEGASGDAATSAVVGIAYEPETLSPLLGFGKDGNSKIFDGLLTHDADLKLKPALAAALPEVSDDGRTYTYALREGVKFSDGEPFTAKDVVFTYETILDEKTNNASKGELDAIESVEAKGDDTVVFRLKYPYAPFAERTVLPIVPERIAGGQDVNTGSFGTEPVGTGPYKLAKWSKGEQLVLQANSGYWGGLPKIERFTMAIIKDDDVRATRLRSGDLDGAILPPNLAKAFRGSGQKTYAAKSFDYRAVTLPTGNKVTGNTAVRRALDIAVDRQAMVDGILEGASKVAHGPVPTDSEWFTEGTERTYDPKKARTVLDAAGWKPGKDGIRVKDGVRASFPLWYVSGDKLRQDHALAYASDAKKIGVEVEVQAGTSEVIEPERRGGRRAPGTQRVRQVHAGPGRRAAAPARLRRGRHGRRAGRRLAPSRAARPAHRLRDRLPAATPLGGPPAAARGPDRRAAPGHWANRGRRTGVGRNRGVRIGPAGPSAPRGQRWAAAARLSRAGARAAASLARLRRDDGDARRLDHGRAGRRRGDLPAGERGRTAGRRARPGTAGAVVRPDGRVGRVDLGVNVRRRRSTEVNAQRQSGQLPARPCSLTPARTDTR